MGNPNSKTVSSSFGSYDDVAGYSANISENTVFSPDEEVNDLAHTLLAELTNQGMEDREGNPMEYDRTDMKEALEMLVESIDIGDSSAGLNGVSENVYNSIDEYLSNENLQDRAIDALLNYDGLFMPAGISGLNSDKYILSTDYSDSINTDTGIDSLNTHVRKMYERASENGER